MAAPRPVPPPTEATRGGRAAWLDALLLLLLVFLAFAPALGNDWIWDDDQYIHKNPLLRSREGLEQIWLEPKKSPQWYPMVFTTFWLEYRLWGADPTGYHLDNLLLHGLGAILAWRLLRRLRVPGAWLAAAVWAVHPVMVESVAWASERKNVLSGVFYFGAALAFLRWVQAGEARRRAGPLVAALLLFAGALFSKTVTASLPAALLLVLWWQREHWRRPRVLLPLLAMTAAGAAMGLFTAWQEQNKVGAVGEPWSHGFAERLLVAGRAPWFYLQKLVAPWPLVFIYERWDVDPAAWWQWLFPLATVALVLVLFLGRRRWGRGPLVAALVFGGTLFPALGFFNVYPHQFSWVADHFQYHASLAAVALLVALLVRLPVLREARGGAGAAPWLDGPFGLGLPRRPLLPAGVLVGALALVSAGQTTTYKDWKTLWETTWKRNPRAWIAANNLGYWYMSQQPPDLETAELWFRKGLAVHPANARAHGNLALILLRRGQYAGAEEHCRAAIAAEPGYFLHWQRLGEVLRAQGRYEEAAEAFRQAITKCQQNAAPLYQAVPGLWLALGQSLEAAGRIDEAEQAYREEERLYPQGRTVLWARTGRARILARRGLGRAALELLDAVLKVDPNWGPALQVRAWIRACHEDPELRDPAAALATARRLVQNAGQNPPLLDLLAAAQAASGRYRAAARTAAAAAQAAGKAGQEALRADIESRQALYAAGLPFRSPTGLPAAGLL